MAVKMALSKCCFWPQGIINLFFAGLFKYKECTKIFTNYTTPYLLHLCKNILADGGFN